MNGTVRFWNEVKGFGFISGEDSKEYFVHATSLPRGMVLRQGSSVAFSVVKGERGPIAADVIEDGRLSAEELFELYHDSTPPETLVEAVQTITAELIKYLAKHPEELYEIKPRQFEELIAEILASYGWQVHLTPATRDGGYDLFAISKDRAGVETSWVIECKRYREDRKVGVDVARALYGVRNVVMPAGMMMLATTSYFSRDVHALKASRYDLELRDYEDILEWLNEYRPNPGGSLYIKDNRLAPPGEEDR